MEIRPIHSARAYKAALKEIAASMERDPDLDTPEGDRLDVLVTLIQAYEAKRRPMTPPDPIDTIKFRMERGGMRVKDPEPILGKANRVYEILNRRRPLTPSMIRRVHKRMGIPAEVLIREQHELAV